MKEIWKEKFELYNRKNKLKELQGIIKPLKTLPIAEFDRKVDKETQNGLTKELAFWSKCERCDISKDHHDLKIILKKLETMYKDIVGAVLVNMNNASTSENFGKCFNYKVKKKSFLNIFNFLEFLEFRKTGKTDY